jgi:hypothetical protein
LLLSLHTGWTQNQACPDNDLSWLFNKIKGWANKPSHDKQTHHTIRKADVHVRKVFRPLQEGCRSNRLNPKPFAFKCARPAGLVPCLEPAITVWVHIHCVASYHTHVSKMWLCTATTCPCCCPLCSGLPRALFSV